MAADWALIVAGALGGGGLVQFWNARQQRMLAEAERGHQLRMANDQRSHELAGQQRRDRATAYVDFLAYITGWQAELALIYPMMGTGKPLTEVQLPQDRVPRARIAVNTFGAHADTIASVEAREGDAGDFRIQLDQERRVLSALIERIADQANRELALDGQTDEDPPDS